MLAYCYFCCQVDGMLSEDSQRAAERIVSGAIVIVALLLAIIYIILFEECSKKGENKWQYPFVLKKFLDSTFWQENFRIFINKVGKTKMLPQPCPFLLPTRPSSLFPSLFPLREILPSTNFWTTTLKKESKLNFFQKKKEKKNVGIKQRTFNIYISAFKSIWFA